MDTILPFLPRDRVAALKTGQPLPAIAIGSVLFADISGFSALTNSLLEDLGRRRGAEAATRTLNQVYDALLTHVHACHGVVISFSGDGVLCWFPAGEHVRRVAIASVSCAQAMIDELEALGGLINGGGESATLGIKVTVACGETRRMLVGDPEIQRLEVLAGQPVDQVGTAERLASSGELIVDESTANLLQEKIAIRKWRSDGPTGQRFAVVEHVNLAAVRPVDKSAPDPVTSVAIDPEIIQNWVLPAVFERLMIDQEEYLAELRPCVALFGRFTGLDYVHDPDVEKKLDAYVRWVQRTVDRHDGALIQLTTGDKGSYFYAAFGAPIQYGDEATRAASAALDLRRPPELLRFQPSIQLGLAQGRMRVGAYGSELRRTYGVQGSAVNLAARIMMLAASETVLITDDLSHDLVGGFIFNRSRLVEVKGSAQPVRVRELTGRGYSQSDPIGAATKSRMVGREPEQMLLDRAVDDVLNDTGSFVRVSGPAGIGKSTLVSYLVQQLQSKGVAVLVAECQASEMGFAYSAVRPLLRQLLNLDVELPFTNESLWTALQASVVNPDPVWRERIPLLGDALGVTLPEHRSTRLLSAQLRQQILVDLIIDIVSRVASERPLAIAVGDVQWVDEISEVILLALVRASQESALLVVFDHRHSLEDASFIKELERIDGQLHLDIRPLDEAAVKRLVVSILGGAISPLLASFVFRHTQGNPFFVSELIDDLQESDQLIFSDDRWTLVDGITERLLKADCLVSVEGEWRLSDDGDIASAKLGVPDTVQAVVLARADRLPPDVRMTLRVASVVGRSFQSDIILKAHPQGVSSETVVQHLDTLVQREFVERNDREQGDGFGFRHSITREAVYDSLLERQLHDLHWAVAAVMERERPANIEDIAYHYVRADVGQAPIREKAMHYLDAAADRAQREYVNETALSLYNQALALETRWQWMARKVEVLHILGHREEERTTLELLEDIQDSPHDRVALAWAEYHDAVSEYPEALQRVESAMTCARLESNTLAEARAHLQAGAILRHQGILDQAGTEYENARYQFRQSNATPTDVADATFGLGAVYRDQGNLNEAKKYLREALETYEDIGARMQEALTLDLLGFIEQMRHRYDTALDYYRRGLAISKAIGDRAGQARDLQSVAQAHRGLGDYSLAEEALDRCLGIQRRLSDSFLEARTLNELGIIYFLCGQYGNAETALVEAISLSKRIGDEKTYTVAMCNLGQTYRDDGKLHEAESTLRRSLELMQELGYRYNEAWCISDIAMLHLSAGRYKEAIRASQESLAFFREAGAALSMTTDLTTLAEAHRQLGMITQATIHAVEAIEILDDCSGNGPDYPQRDYHLAGLALIAADRRVEGELAITRAQELLLMQSDRITDTEVRKSYLTRVPYNNAIIGRST